MFPAMRRQTRLAWPILLLAACLTTGAAMLWAAMPLSPEPAPDDGQPTLRVLFIGNSLTAGNDLPGLVEALSRGDAGATRRIEAQAVLVGGADLGDQWDAGGVRRAIERGGWDFVVLQQGPSAAPESRARLLATVEPYGPAIRAAAGARPAMYAVWPEKVRMAAFGRVSEPYRLAAEALDGLFLPAGDAWLAAWRRDPALPLYGADDFHPSPAGTYLAALVIYGGLTGRPVAGLPAPGETADGRRFAIPPDQARVLQEAAAEVLKREADATTRPATTRAAEGSP